MACLYLSILEALLFTIHQQTALNSQRADFPWEARRMFSMDSLLRMSSKHAVVKGQCSAFCFADGEEEDSVNKLQMYWPRAMIA